MKRGNNVQASTTAHTEPTSVLLSVAEQLKISLSTIARQAELAQLTGTASFRDIAAIGVQAGAAMTLVESYLLGLQLLHEQAELQLEPVSVSSILADTAHELHRYAQAHEVQVELHIAGKYEPVMAHRRGLKAALLSLGYELIGSQAPKQQMVMAAHRASGGIVAGMYGSYEELSTETWRRSLQLCGRAGQSLTAVSAGSSAGLFVANTILQAMSAHLRVGRHRKQSGLVATLQPSRQLVLV